MEFRVLEHEIRRSSCFFIHNAVVVTDTPVMKETESSLINDVSARVGYHPFGYGIYGKATVTKRDGEDNVYVLEWKTANSCD